MKFTRISASTFQKLQLNAGILLTQFSPSTGEVVEGNLLGATSGGNNFTATPTFEDFGEDIDNCPKNTKELKKLTEWEVKISGTMVTVDTQVAKRLVGAADIDEEDTTKVIPRNDVLQTDFTDIWWVGDYSDENNDTTGGFVAIRMINALSTGGFQIKSGDKAKGTFSFEFTAHYSMEAQDTVPFEIYIKSGTATPSVLTELTVASAAGSSTGTTAITITGYTPSASESYVYKTDALAAPEIEYGEIPDYTWAEWDGTSDITATNGYKITIASITTSGAVAAGDTTVVSNT